MDYDPTSPPATNREEFEKYFDKETQSMASEDYSDKEDMRLKRQRAMFLLDAVAKKETDVFISYLALSYFDRFLSRAPVELEDIQLAIVCCIFLAAKMRDKTFSVHLFMTNWPNLIFDSDFILAMEEHILTTIEWRLQSVTALCFVEYIGQVLPNELRPSRKVVNEIIIQTQSEMRLTKFRPSVIAATATFTASSVQLPVRFRQCFNCFASCNHLNMEDFNRCLEIMMGSCKRKRFLKATFLVREGSRSSGVSHRPGKEPVVESTETMETSERGPGMEPVVESSKAMDVPRRRPGKEPVVESSDTRIKKETVLESSQIIDLILEGLGLVPMPEIPEVSEGVQREWKNLLDEARHAPIQSVPAISEEPERGNENVLDFELKWLTEEEEGMAREYIQNLSLAASSSRIVSSHAAQARNTGDISNPATDFARGARVAREVIDRHSRGRDRGTRLARSDAFVRSAASDRGARSDAFVRRAVSDRFATAERHDADRHSTEGDRGATAEPDITSLHKGCKLQ